MSSIHTMKMISDTKVSWGREWFYDFRELNLIFTDEKCKRIVSRLSKRYSKLTSEWSNELNSEWICRHYMAAKLVMAATLHINAMNFSEETNLRVVIPYLRYYTILSLMRAVCYTLPEYGWEDGKLIRMSHQAAINGTFEHLRHFDKEFANNTKREIIELKAEREMISYRAPSTGDAQINEKNTFIQICTLLAEVAQFNSELIEASLLKKGDRSCFVFMKEYAYSIANFEIDGVYFGDIEDAYRLDYLSRKHPILANIQHMMTEGHVEDFFGAWHSGEDTAEHFNPDENWGVIFDIP